MKVLIVNCFEESKKGYEAFNDFSRCIQVCLKDALQEFPDADEQSLDIECRKLDCLVDMIVDWEYQVLDDSAKHAAVRFDILDVIVIGGDMSILPWEPRCIQLVQLLKLAEKSGKPVLGCGTGAFASVYAICTGGMTFHLLNGPNGESIDKLSTFGRYGGSSGQFPSAWMDNDTGDLYIYDVSGRVWRPICNIGQYRVASNVIQEIEGGPPENKRHISYRQAEKRFSEPRCDSS